MVDATEVLFIGGRSGVGKSSVAFEMSNGSLPHAAGTR
jgi:2-phosphoglycerate kinase